MPQKKIDPTFQKFFQIETPIIYTPDLIVERGFENSFWKSWNRFYPKSEPQCSESREKQLNAFLKKLKQNGNDYEFNDKVSIRYIDDKIGYGVFAKEDIGPYKILNHYSGMIRLEKHIDENNDSTFSFTDFPKFAIDATKYGNWCRFMNHGDENDPATNVVVWEHYTSNGPYIIFTSGSKGIEKGKQLLYSYGDKYWEEDDHLVELK